VNGSGADIWNTSDQFYFVYQALSGDGEISAHVTTVENTNTWAKAGVMIRQTTAADSKHAMMALTPSQGASFQRRTSTGGVSVSTTNASIGVPYWVKVSRTGNTFKGFISNNGLNWTEVNSIDISMTPNVLIGLVVTSHDSSTMNTSIFKNVVVGTNSTFADDFQDGDISDWSPSGGTWSVTNGNLVGNSPRKGSIYSNVFSGCNICTLEADMEVQTAGAKVSVIGWHADKQNMVELMMDEAKDKWVLKVHSAGGTASKTKFVQTINTFTNYHVKIVFTGTTMDVIVNGNSILSVPATIQPGNVGFKVKGGTGSFKQILVY
jgi:hypothetical protein